MTHMTEAEETYDEQVSRRMNEVVATALTALALRDERNALIHKMRVARAHIEQVIASLIKDPHGNQREPSLSECEARETIELLQQIHEELAP